MSRLALLLLLLATARVAADLPCDLAVQVDPDTDRARVVLAGTGGAIRVLEGRADAEILRTHPLSLDGKRALLVLWRGATGVRPSLWILEAATGPRRIPIEDPLPWLAPEVEVTPRVRGAPTRVVRVRRALREGRPLAVTEVWTLGRDRALRTHHRYDPPRSVGDALAVLEDALLRGHTALAEAIFARFSREDPRLLAALEALRERVLRSRPLTPRPQEVGA